MEHRKKYQKKINDLQIAFKSAQSDRIVAGTAIEAIELEYSTTVKQQARDDLHSTIAQMSVALGLDAEQCRELRCEVMAYLDEVAASECPGKSGFHDETVVTVLEKVVRAYLQRDKREE